MISDLWFDHSKTRGTLPKFWTT